MSWSAAAAEVSTRWKAAGLLRSVGDDWELEPDEEVRFWDEVEARAVGGLREAEVPLLDRRAQRPRVFDPSEHPRNRRGEFIDKAAVARAVAAAMRSQGRGWGSQALALRDVPVSLRSDWPPDVVKVVHDESREGLAAIPRDAEDLPEQVAAIVAETVVPPPSERDWGEDAALVALWDGFEHAGLRAIVTDVEDIAGGAQISGRIRDTETNDDVGHFVRKTAMDGMLVYHDRLKLAEGVRDRGFGTAFVRESEDRYRAAGIEEVALVAGDENGGYVWAREGYDFRIASPARRSYEVRQYLRVMAGKRGATHYDDSHGTDAVWFAQERGLPEEQRRLFFRKLGFPDPGEDGVPDEELFQTPQEIAAFGREYAWQTPSGRTTWAGKQFLMGSEWAGIKRLTPSVQEAVSAEAIAEVSRRLGLRVPPDAGAADDGPEVWDEAETLREARFREADRPRDRLGRWIDTLGLRAYPVGGAVRDPLLGKRPKDVDYMVAATPEAIRAAVEATGHRATDLTVRDRLVGVRAFGPELPEEGVELAPPRMEVSTGPGRHDFDIVPHPEPESAEALESDALRRDFTLNALYRDPETNDLIDPTGHGEEDARNGVLRTITPESFRDDPLRILRGLRFMSQHGLTPEARTWEQMVEHADAVTALTRGGVSGTARTELDKTLMGDGSARAMRMMRDARVADAFLPEADLDDERLAALERATEMAAPLRVRLATIFPDGEEAKAALGRLGYPRAMTEDVGALVRHGTPGHAPRSDAEVRRMRAHVGDDLLDDLITLRAARGGDFAALAAAEQMRAQVQVSREAGDPVRLRDLDVDGRDLVALGLSGPEVGETLRRLLDVVLEDPAANDRDRLLDVARGLREAAIANAPSSAELARIAGRRRRSRAGQFADEPGGAPTKPKGRGGSSTPQLPSAQQGTPARATRVKVGGGGAQAQPKAVAPVRAPEGFVAAGAVDRARLKVPPAWRDVFVATDPDARLMAVGRDGKGRVQRVYSAKHHEEQAVKKWARVSALTERLPQIDADLTPRVAQGDDTAAALMLVRRMGLRPGTERDRGGSKKAYGATTLEARHVKVNGNQVSLRFTGKGGKDIPLAVEDPDVAAMLRERVRGKKAREQIFPGTNENRLRELMDEVAGEEFTPKDFRTHLATGEAALMVMRMDPPRNEREYRAKRLEVGRAISSMLGNTPKLALDSYISPVVFGPWSEHAPKAKETT